MKTGRYAVISGLFREPIKRVLRTGGLGLLLVFLSACIGLSKAPEINLAGVDLIGLGLFEQRFVLKLAIRNPNDLALSIKTLNFDIELDGHHFAKGASEKPLTVASRGEAVLEVMSVSHLSTILDLMRDARQNGRTRVAFRIYGRAEIDGIGRIPFERTGEIPLPGVGLLKN